MATRVFDGIKNLRTPFKEDHLRNIPAKFASNWPRGLGGVDVLKKLLMTRNRHRVILKAPHEHAVLR